MTLLEIKRGLQENLQSRYEAGEAGSITRIVLEDVFEYRADQPDREASSEEEMLYRHIQQRLLRGEPVQYILGEADFYGLKFGVDPRVLIPRQETEELVHWVLETWKQSGKPTEKKILDIGTGTGCIPITIKHEAPALTVSGLDVRADILELAAANARRNEVEVAWIEQDILNSAGWPELGNFDYIISNPPYIPPSQRHLMPEHVLSHEPELALFAPENDPLVFYREIGLLAFQQLLPDGYLFFETNEYNAERVVELLKDIGFKSIELRQDLGGKDRMIRAGR
ncbi:peptide chain release factor N(5)-glutamine methyltransferase [Flavilitoribacter nigricans]|uniref:peptide chain release factor N(5)-glutamine methyltransferase n=1 Tax=Flavilitoribacter nigricans (strain ATCC 23147 / DSM 23189 / NBRC 102662 / NCIMB 1420 / SS-2) TaxID=1122177 RepID=A0A2D0NBT5_FLAN2|nr:peptide chain release factor N(5)-glutamine methyltransferase [Flavilitoribacter nigricans]PHN05964.1 protein-(glutamine-N5) methyltransferase, release factor-specific [Flavilitoribacter nigricans DSM 23189 = NBRC 102662]